ncbi:Connectin [Papilio machaon]|uniref:Connectin n=1 Tax=Papilio machaon TaxID=76193 RepID=A0A194RIT0_PAPMA|nr:Connectin [Papilio machaon]
MTAWKIITLTCFFLLLAEAKPNLNDIGENNEVIPSICDPGFNTSDAVQCFCAKDDHNIARSAECYPTIEEISQDDPAWSKFDSIKNAVRISLTNNRGISFKFIPKNALKHTHNLLRLDVKYANVKVIEPFAFANLSLLEDIKLSGNQIEKLKPNAFSHLETLKTISLDTNNIMEINRDVFVSLPALEKLFITNNKVTIIHDKAFIHLTNLKELEIDRNKLFSLNSETFSGLGKLKKLDLSGNNLEVIGDNTFKPLTRLISLNLDENKIQMLDSKAFHGLSKLQSLSLAHNELSDIDNVNVFQGLTSLTALSLKGNRISTLRQEVMAPIMDNFYQNIASLDIEDNLFPCDCRLEWLMVLMNKTESASLKLILENFKCIPDAKLRDRWTKRVELEKNSQTFDGEEPSTQSQDYEYYDDAELNGKLFYTDVRDLLHCNSPTGKPLADSLDVVKKTNTAAGISPLDPEANDAPNNPGYFDESIFKKNKTKKSLAAPKTDNSEVANQEIKDDKPNISTTTRLATVSAKPMEKRTEETKDMASDEAKSDNAIAHRSVQEKGDDYSDFFTNGQDSTLGSFKAVVLMSVLNVRFLLN